APRTSEDDVVQAGLLARGSWPFFAFPHLVAEAQWHFEAGLAADSCGGSSGLDCQTRQSHRIPFWPVTPTGTPERRRLWGVSRRLSTLECASASYNTIGDARGPHLAMAREFTRTKPVRNRAPPVGVPLFVEILRGVAASAGSGWVKRQHRGRAIRNVPSPFDA